MPDLEPNPSINTPDNKVEGNDFFIKVVSDDEFEGVNTLNTWRTEPPAHYRLRIESFSSLPQFLDKKGLDKYESKEFEASGHNWKLLLYPNGDEKRNGSGHISLYLKSMEPWRKINAFLIFFIYDQVKKEYLSIQDKTVRQFAGPKMEQWGLSQLVSLYCFRNDSNGFLANDCCEFGVEVFVLEGEAKRECFPRREPKQSAKVYVWNVNMHYCLEGAYLVSQPFVAGGFTWNLNLYSKSNPEPGEKYLSIHLYLKWPEKVPSDWKMYVEFKLSVNDQVHENKSDKIEKIGKAWFSASEPAWGFPNFILADLERLKSLTVDDELQIELQIISISMPKSI